MRLRSIWKEIVIGVLVLILSITLVEHSLLSARYGQTTQTVQRQTQLIVELRKQSVKLNFDNLDELKYWVDDWVAYNKPVVLQILNKSIVLTGNDELYSQYWDCDDLAEAMQRDALRDGYLMSVCLIDRSGTVFEVKVSDYYGHHTGCAAIAGNAYYYIEPQTGDIVMITVRD